LLRGRQLSVGPRGVGGRTAVRTVRRRYTQFEELHLELIGSSGRGRLYFERGDARHRRMVKETMGRLTLPEKKLWNSAGVVRDRVEHFNKYLRALQTLQMHSLDIRGVVLGWLCDDPSTP
jgi:hypothetical protein